MAVTAAGRLGGGAAAFIRPEALPRLLGLDRGTARRGRLLVRLFAAREAALGLGTLWALGAGQDVRPWVLAQAVSDAGDAVAALAATRDRAVPTARGAAVAVAALTGVAGAGVALWATRRRQH